MPEVTSERVWISGPQGRLSGELAYGHGAIRGAALVLSPHPYMGGRMRLPLLTRIAEALAERNIASLRFDYGGIGESEGPRVQIGAAMQQFWDTGSAPEDPLRIEEAGAASAWLASNVERASALIGYSFGSYVAARLHGPGVAAMVMIAPTISRHDYTGFRNDRTATLIVYGQGDFATGDDQVQAWASALACPAEVRRFEAGDHFFRGIEGEVANVSAEFVVKELLAAGRVR